MSDKPLDPNSWEIYRMHTVESLKWLTEEVRKNHDEILTLKVRQAMFTIVISIGTSIITGVLTYVISHKLIP